MVLPLFPQYAYAVTGSILKELNKALSQLKISAQVIEPFYIFPGYIQAFAARCQEAMHSIQAEFLLMSYHGLPERQMEHNRQYKKQCEDTSGAIAKALSLPVSGYQTAFQSRLGRTAWIQPYTEQLLSELRARGIKRLAVVCPSFVADCLETLEEIGIRAREQWISLGGESFVLVPSLNASPAWVKSVSQLCIKATCSS